jgi:hypothetical protein
LRPITVPTSARLAGLIADLDNSSFAVREKATIDLGKFGELAQPVLRQALAKDFPLETRRRLQLLLNQLDRVPTDEQVWARRVVALLERIDSAEVRQILQALAKGAREARLTQEAQAALQRLAKAAGGNR